MSEESNQPHGPIFVSAFACEKVLRELDGMLTPVRLLTAMVSPPIEISYPPMNDSPARVDYRYAPVYFSIVALFLSDKNEKFTVIVKGTKPNGAPLEGGPGPKFIDLKGGLGGSTIVYDLNMPSDQEGVFWINLYISGDVVSKVPLLVVHSLTSSRLTEYQNSVATRQEPT